MQEIYGNIYPTNTIITNLYYTYTRKVVFAIFIKHRDRNMKKRWNLSVYISLDHLLNYCRLNLHMSRNFYKLISLSINWIYFNCIFANKVEKKAREKISEIFECQFISKYAATIKFSNEIKTIFSNWWILGFMEF